MQMLWLTLKNNNVKEIIAKMNKFFGYEGNSYSIILTDLQPFNYGIYFNDNDMLKIYSILSINRSFKMTKNILKVLRTHLH